MRAIFGLVFLFGLALAGAAVFLAKSYIGQQEAAAAFQATVMERTGGLTEVIVATTPKDYGDMLKPEDVQTILWPKNALPKGVFTDKAALFPEDGAPPRYITRRVEAFEPILAVKVTEPGQQAGLNGALEPGMRAFAINVEVSDLLQVGDHVDLYWTGVSSSTNAEVTRLIENRLKIIAIDHQLQDGLSNGTITQRSLTVAVTPQQVARLAQAQATGKLVTSLVGLKDLENGGVVEIDSNTLLGTSGLEPNVNLAAGLEQKVCTVRNRRAGDLVEIAIPCAN